MNNVIWSALLAAVLAVSAVATSVVLLFVDEVSPWAVLQTLGAAAIVAAILSLRER